MGITQQQHKSSTKKAQKREICKSCSVSKEEQPQQNTFFKALQHQLSTKVSGHVSTFEYLSLIQMPPWKLSSRENLSSAVGAEHQTIWPVCFLSMWFICSKEQVLLEMLKKRKGRKKCWIQKSLQAASWANDQERQKKQNFTNQIKSNIQPLGPLQTLQRARKDGGHGLKHTF